MEYGWILEKSFEIKDEIVACRRKIHTLAEVGFETEKTKKFIHDELVKIGLSPRYAGGGVVCEIVGEAEFYPLTNIDGKNMGAVTEKIKNIPKSKCVLLRADIDALPIYEETNIPFRAKNGNMHACGHDMHAATLIGAAKILNGSKEKLCGTVKLVFQSAEEILSGAKEMIAAKVMENPRVDCCVALHMVLGTELEAGTVILPSNQMSAPYADFFRITVKGEGGHGAAPEKSKNAALCAAAITIEIGKLVSKRQANDFSVSICQINSGNAPNVIPEKCDMSGNLRALSPQARNNVTNEIEEICHRVSKAHGCMAEFELTSSTCALFCNENLSKCAEECLKSAFSSPKNKNCALVLSALKSTIKASTPSEDFAEFANRAPSVLLGISAGKKSTGFSYPLHNPRAIFDEEALPFATASYATIAIGFLNTVDQITNASQNKQNTGF